MKTKRILFAALAAALFSSCGSITYYQVYKTASSNELAATSSNLVYEDDNCKVSYNLWSEGGNIGFQFYNKTDHNIYLNLEESFFVLNGISHNYYRSRVFTNSTSSGAASTRSVSATRSVTGVNYLDLVQTDRISAVNTVGLMASSGFSVSYNEEKVVCIPSKTSKVISEYSINKSLLRDCDLFKYPSKKRIRTKNYTKEQSPLVFSNRIAYSLGRTDSLVRFENEFYVKEVVNYPASEVFEYRYEEYCGQKSEAKEKYFKNASADKFYNRYIKGQGIWKH
ncbi:hypothetical protein [Alistipes sp. ZOR0009]|uniref:hypothetical protein n=1 Tax=Alistipes sp. ZOR0009 TaxID=1339253 RepID=UPI000646FDC7|nr:hypothetical protein [Alistipes sp. ZOR0009]